LRASQAATFAVFEKCPGEQSLHSVNKAPVLVKYPPASHFVQLECATELLSGVNPYPSPVLPLPQDRQLTEFTFDTGEYFPL
jgi:hypothetical protein